MRIFLSWSGSRSKALAIALRDWLQGLLVTVEPWVSDRDIEKGQRWSAEIAGQLSECKFGIICLTPENINKPWLHFEAGALSKTVPDACVCPLLFELDKLDVVGPLAQFQLTTVARDDIKRLLETINKAVTQTGERAFQDQQVTRAFDRAWPELEAALRSIPKHPTSQPRRSDRAVLNEILEIVRQLGRRPSAIGTSARERDLTLAALRGIAGPDLATNLDALTKRAAMSSLAEAIRAQEALSSELRARKTLAPKLAAEPTESPQRADDSPEPDDQ